MRFVGIKELYHEYKKNYTIGIIFGCPRHTLPMD